MKILYAAGLSPKESSLYRLWALERLGHHVVPFNTFDYLPRSPLIRKVAHRLSAGPSVNLQRDKNILDYTSRGARDVIKIQTAYEPTLHYPPPAGWSDADRDRQVSFVGTPYDDRAQTLGRLWRDCGFSVAVSGSAKLWGRAMQPDVFKATFRDGELYRNEYRNAIWRSRINLSFLTHSNQDEFVHKSFEIAGCGGFLLAERSAGHLQRFKEDEEAVFFSSFDELAEKIRRYLPDEAARQRIATAGNLRAARDGYHNDRQVGLIIERIQSLLSTRKTAEATANPALAVRP